MKLNQTEIRALARRLTRRVKEDLPKIESDLYKSKKIKPLFEKWEKIEADLSKLEQERGKLAQSIDKAIREKINLDLIHTCTWKSNRKKDLPYYLEEISLTVLDVDSLAELTKTVLKSLNMESK